MPKSRVLEESLLLIVIKMNEKNVTSKIIVPEGLTAAIQDRKITVKGPKGEVSKSFIEPCIHMKISGNEIVFTVTKFTKNEKKLLGTYKAHINNMFKGVTDGHNYELKICSGHFPMNVSYNNNVLQVKNFLGEKIPRELKVGDVEMKVDGDKITVSGIDKEEVAQTAASVEQLTRRSSFDKRVFQDGIYIVNKDGKQIK